MSADFPEYFEEVDKEIYSYLNLDSPSSFLLFAGAGSGKTRTLVNVLEHIKKNDIKRFIDNGSKIAVITYTNAACDEINHRLHFDPAFSVSTIHSFAWDLIKPFTEDIREFLLEKVQAKIADLQNRIDRARDKNGITAVKNARSRDSQQRRLDQLHNITEFSYSPSSGKPERDSLNHSEIIDMAATFIAESALMQRLLVNRFPILLIDESQDTNKGLMSALISAQQSNKDIFALGLFGDMMQRIYGGGKDDLDTSLPEDWKKPAKLINYRSPKRIINLINNIRLDIDQMQQDPSESASEGLVRLFIVNTEQAEKHQVENSVRSYMVEATEDELWNNTEGVKCLILEHAMAADRGKFSDFFTPLASIPDFRDSVLNGTSREVKFIINLVLPLVESIKNDESFETMRLLKLGARVFSSANQHFEDTSLVCLEAAEASINDLKPQLIDDELNLQKVIKYFSDHQLLDIPSRLATHLDTDVAKLSDEDKSELDSESLAWAEALQADLGSVTNYSDYVNERSGFATHQGVKGLEFDRVMAVLDDESAGGFLFKYEKLFGAEQLSATDVRNETQGLDSTPLRTRRLFYVICSRAEKSLAIVAYTKNPQAVKEYALKSWFTEDEIVVI
jgi:DNA helicase-2/ATP-dependent DNA helicase PcrA